MISPEELARRRALDPTALAYSDLELGLACALCPWAIDKAPLEVYEAKIVAHLKAAHNLRPLTREDNLGRVVRIPTGDGAEEIGDFKAHPAECRACAHRWIAVADVADGEKPLECPNCQRPAGRFEEPTK